MIINSIIPFHYKISISEVKTMFEIIEEKVEMNNEVNENFIVSSSCSSLELDVDEE
nr:McmA [Thermoactinomyces sp.]